MEYDSELELLNNEDVLDLFDPKFVPYIRQLLLKGNIGICFGHIQLADIVLQNGDFKKIPKSSDRFKVIVPYGGHTVTWDIVFDRRAPEFPPDFAFDDTTFLSNVDVATLEENVPSLVGWNPEEPEALVRVVQELLACYCKHQVAQLDDYQRLLFEYTSLVGETALSEKDVEVFLGKRRRRGDSEQANFLIRLPVDFSALPPLLTKYNPGKDSAVLLVVFHSPQGNRISPQLFLSPGIEQALAGSSQLHLPLFLADGCLMDYVPLVVEILNARVDTVVAGFEKRKEYFLMAAVLFERSLIDVHPFKKISFLFEKKDFHFWVQISLSSEFPQEKPMLKFVSVYHVLNGKPFIEKCDNYPYSPRWSAEEMVQRLKSFILDFAEVFKRNCMRACQL